MRLYSITLLLLVGAGVVTILGATVVALVFWLTRRKNEKDPEDD